MYVTHTRPKRDLSTYMLASYVSLLYQFILWDITVSFAQSEKKEELLISLRCNVTS